MPTYSKDCYRTFLIKSALIFIMDLIETIG